ncbi:MAG: hypothetical protein HUK23_07200, partial [Sphaerochaetaceae bacterium]|nr:hypothetical protein [Sphaerochaetaceae bacterium]
EPWRNDVCLKNIRQTIEDHYTHMPYIYNVAYEAALTGTPMERPLFLEYPNENIPTDIEQSLFGSSVLKTPILNEGQSKLNVLLPNGNDWYCPMDNKLYNGGTTQTFDVPLDSYYYFYKTGSVIPTTKTVSKLRTGFFNELNFRIIPANGTTTYDYFEDDGTSVLSMNSYNLWRITVDYNQKNQLGKVSIECTKLGNKDSLSNRSIEFSFPKGFIGNTSISVDQASKGFSFEFSGCF